MLIRQAQINDLEEITAILNQAINWGKATAITQEFRAAERIDWFKESTSGRYCILVSEDEQGKITGYVSITPYRKGRQAFLHTAEISYFIHFDHHKKGIASALMEEALDHCRKNEIKTLVAFLMAHNLPSVHFMEKYGFEQWGLFPRSITINGQEFDHAIYGKRVE